MGHLNRTFRMGTPQRATVCRNTCHELQRQVRGSAQAQGSSRHQAWLADEYSINSYARLGGVRFPVTQQKVSWDVYASGTGERFVALRIDEQSGMLIPVELQWERQSFLESATIWERRYSPLVTRDTSSFIAVVDEWGTIIGYYAHDVELFSLRLYKLDGGEVDLKSHWETTESGPSFVLFDDEEVIYDDRDPLPDSEKKRGEVRLDSQKNTTGRKMNGKSILFDVNGLVQSNFTRHFDEVSLVNMVTNRDIVEFFAVGGAIKLVSSIRAVAVMAVQIPVRAGLIALRTIRLTARRAGKVLSSAGRILETPSQWLAKVLSKDRKVPVKLVDPTRLSNAVGPLPRGSGALHPHTDPTKLINSAGTISRERALHPHPDWAPPPSLSKAEKQLARPPFTERGYFDITSKKTYLVRAEGQAQGAGRWGDDLFESFDEAEKYVRKQLAPVGKARIKEQSALPDTWVGGATGNTADKVVIYAVPEKTPFIRGVVGEQFEAGGAKLYHGGGPQVVLGVNPGTLVSIKSFPISKP